jgi:hypothetical protein
MAEKSSVVTGHKVIFVWYERNTEKLRALHGEPPVLLLNFFYFFSWKNNKHFNATLLNQKNQKRSCIFPTTA